MNDNNGVIRIRKSKDRQYNGQKDKQRSTNLRDRPFNLKGGGGYGFFFRSKFFFRTIQELEYFFCRAIREFFFPEFNIRLYDKNSESDYFFFPPPKSEYFFQQHWESEYFFLEKNHNPPFKLNGRSLT